MSERPDERRLRELLGDTAGSLEPGERLEAIRTEARSAAVATRRRRRTWWTVGGAAVATAAASAAVVVALGQTDGPVTGPDPAPPAGQTTEPTPPAGELTDGTSPKGPTVAVPLYFVGDTPQGPRLYREFAAAPEDSPLSYAAEAVVEGESRDPDYRTLWPEGTEILAEVAESDEELIVVDVGTDGSDLRTRPPRMTEAEAALAIEQVIHTVQGVVGARAPVLFQIDGQRTERVLGVPTAEPLAASPPIDVRSHVNLTEPAEGATVSGTVQVTGVASSFEATVPWELRRGGEVVEEGFFTAEGWMGRLYPFSGDIDLAGLDPGTYSLAVLTSDASGGAEGPGPYVDTRTVVIE